MNSKHTSEFMVSNADNAQAHGCNKECKTFRGYTLDDIKYQRVVNQLRINVTQHKIINEIKDHSMPKARAVATGILSFDNIMRYADAALIGMAVFSRIRRFMGIFHRRK